MNRAKAEVVVDALINAVIARVNADITKQTLPMHHHKPAEDNAAACREAAITALCPVAKEDDETC